VDCDQGVPAGFRGPRGPGGHVGEVKQMIRDTEIKKRLNGVIDQLVLPIERERVARYTIDRLVPEVKKLIQEELQNLKSRRTNA